MISCNLWNLNEERLINIIEKKALNQVKKLNNCENHTGKMPLKYGSLVKLFPQTTFISSYIILLLQNTSLTIVLEVCIALLIIHNS